MPAPFVWYDLTVSPSTAEATRAFYAELLDWTVNEDDSGAPYAGWLIDGDQPWAAMVTADQPDAGRWIPFVQVADLGAATAKATSLGATVLTEPTPGPAGVAVRIADPTGALIALWTPHASKP